METISSCFLKYVLFILLPILLCQQGCKKEDELDKVPPVPPRPISINIDWSSDMDRYEEDHMRFDGKASITLNLNFDPETDLFGNTVYYLTGTGSGTQYDCTANVDPPDWVENVSAGDFTVSVFGGYYAEGNPSKYIFSLESNNANFSFEVVEDRGGGAVYRWPQDVDELEFVISDISFEMDAIKEFVYSKQDTTLLGTVYVVLAAWVY